MSNVIDIKVPDIGDFKDVPVIEIFVKVGDTVEAEDPLVSLESDKATMDVPAPLAGMVKEIRVKLGDKVSEGSVIMALATGDARAAAAAPSAAAAVATAAPAAAAPAAAANASAGAIDEAAFALAYAGPAVRKLARELAVDLGQVKGTGDHGRIVRADVEAFAKGCGASAGPAAKAAALPVVASAASTCCLGPRSTSPSSDPSSARSSRASRRSRRPICTAIGS